MQVALNVSAPGDRTDLIYLVANTTMSGTDTPHLPDPTFLTISMATNASDPVFIAHSAVGLSEKDNYLWANYEGYLIPRPRGDMVGGGFYLLPTSVEGIWSMRFIMNDETAKQLGAIKTHLFTAFSRKVGERMAGSDRGQFMAGE